MTLMDVDVTSQFELAEPADLDDRRLYVNRELSLLSFQERVLAEAEDASNPLLERAKFLTIVASNLGEFFMVRVGGLKQQIEAGVVEISVDGLTPSEQLALVRPRALALMDRSRACLLGLLPLLDAAGVHILGYSQLDRRQKETADRFFVDVVFPVLTPLAVDPGRPFPHISNLSLNLAVVVEDDQGDERFARLKVPAALPRLMTVPEPAAGPPAGELSNEVWFVMLEEVIAANLGQLFPGMRVKESYAFRITRNAELVIQELEAEDLLEMIERGVHQRRFASVTRLTVERAMPERIRSLLLENLEVGPEDMYATDSPLAISGLTGLQDLDRPDLKDAPFVPGVPAGLHDLEEEDLFAVIRRRDILLHHPFDSFLPVIDFLTAASNDPSVLAIKMTLYRVGRNAPVVAALLNAARNGKQVAVLVELKARFDEESNIEWARALEAEGVHVIYGLLGLKTHSKIALVVRQEGDGLRRYVHLATGNYNAVTAHLYTDIGLFTCAEEFGADASDFFNFLTGYSTQDEYRRFLVAPRSLRTRVEELIEREIDNAGRGCEARIIFKMNALVDRRMIRLLYRASQAGVRVDLLVRGICCLRPGIPGVSDNIRVTSIIGRFLEHSRIYYFWNCGEEEVYLGSADLMPRNLNRRVEVLFPVLDPRILRTLRDVVLAIYLDDNVRARHMQPDGTYVRAAPGPGEEPVDSQAWLLSAEAR
jgi:polyphosphate kinase